MIRCLLLADSHIGFDLPLKPRVERRRRGDDFLANYRRALKPALTNQVDLVVHGGDLLFRSQVPPAIIEQALNPLVEVAQQGVPVFLVPGNHERGRIPRHLLTAHPNLFIFHEPATFSLELPGGRLALAGFPFTRRIRDEFQALLASTGYQAVSADIRLLCLHQTVEGAQVGPSDYTFRAGPDIIPGTAVPAGFAAVLAGHIHRGQVLRHDLAHRPLAAPVIYPGSIERTAFAERNELKYYVKLTLEPTEAEDLGNGRLVDVVYVKLPTRPMRVLTLDTQESTGASLVKTLRHLLQELPSDAVVRIDLKGDNGEEIAGLISAAMLRELAPITMNVSLNLRGQAAGRTPTL